MRAQPARSAPLRELGPKIRAAAAESEQGRRLPMHLVGGMQPAGLFRMAMPRAWGGPELDFLTQVQVIEALSIADPSAGWCTMIGIDGGYMTAYIDQSVAREMFSDIDSVTATTFAPPGKAVKTRDGFIVSDRWRTRIVPISAFRTGGRFGELPAADSTPLAWACFSGTTWREGRKTTSPLIAVQG
jgi:hypothetical protein